MLSKSYILVAYKLDGSTWDISYASSIEVFKVSLPHTQIVALTIPCSLNDVYSLYIDLKKTMNGKMHTENLPTNPDGFADGIWNKLKILFGVQNRSSDPVLNGIMKSIKGDLRYGPPQGRYEYLCGPMISEVDTTYADELLKVLSGKALTLAEVVKCLSDKNIQHLGSLGFMLEYMHIVGLCTILPGVSVDRNSAQCNRCGSTTQLVQTYCPRCLKDECWLCLECRNMGEVRSCGELYFFNGAPDTTAISDTSAGIRKELTFDFPLTQPQIDASTQLCLFARSISDSVKIESCLVWAVCGAGKTEVAFSAVNQALGQGKRVLFAIPRRDVVLELESRLRQAFCGIDIEVLYGGSGKPFGRGQLVLATTHQVLRRYKEYDLVIIDEADAFPFLGNRMLMHAVNRSMAPGAKLIYMSATPDKVLRQNVKDGKTSLITIPARHHGCPLPVPILKEIELCPIGDKVGRLLIKADMVEVIKDSVLSRGRKLFVFVPTIALVTGYVKCLRQLLSGVNIDGTHSKDSDRLKKREDFQRGQITILVTTSIMERGITVKGCDVIVLHSDYDKIFDERALVQMAGRVGRSTDDADGYVAFFGRSINSSMELAKAQIIKMNDEALLKGYLHAQQ